MKLFFSFAITSILSSSVLLGACTTTTDSATPAGSQNADGGSSSVGTGGGTTPESDAGTTDGATPTTGGKSSLPREGWGADQCTGGGTEGFKAGETIPDVKVKDCDGNEVSLRATCGAAGGWVFLAHGWCPHCKLVGKNAEDIAKSYAGKNLAAVQVLVESSSYDPPTAADCKAWRDGYGHAEVITLYDDTNATRDFWERNSTSLNVFWNKDQVITSKVHTDVTATITGEIDGALAQ